MTLADLLSSIPAEAVKKVRGTVSLEVKGVTVDSRAVDPSFVFVAIAGQTTDGHRYIGEAIKRGAVAVVSENAPGQSGLVWVRTPDARRAAGLLAASFLGQPSRQLSLVGVTGTNGKTTTAFLLDAVFQSLVPPSAMMGTVVHRVGSVSKPARHTTQNLPSFSPF